MSSDFCRVALWCVPCFPLPASDGSYNSCSSCNVVGFLRVGLNKCGSPERAGGRVAKVKGCDQNSAGRRKTKHSVVSPRIGACGACMGFSKACRLLRQVAHGVRWLRARAEHLVIRVGSFKHHYPAFFFCHTGAKQRHPLFGGEMRLSFEEGARWGMSAVLVLTLSLLSSCKYYCSFGRASINISPFSFVPESILGTCFFCGSLVGLGDVAAT